MGADVRRRTHSFGQRMDRLFADLFNAGLMLRVALLGSVLLSAAVGLSDVFGSVTLRFLIPTAALALTGGWIFARSSKGAWVSAGSMLVGGVGWVTLQVAQLAPILGDLVGWALRWMVSGLQRESAVTEGEMVADAIGRATDALGVLIQRLLTSLVANAGDAAQSDPIVDLFFWGVLFWFAAWFAAWQVRRHRNVLAATLPAGFILAFSLTYTRWELGRLYLFLGATLILLALVSQERRESQWRGQGLSFLDEVPRSTLSLAVLVSLVLLVASATLSSVSWGEVIEQVIYGTKRAGDAPQGLGENPHRRAGGEPQEDPLRALRLAGLPRDHLMGSGPELNEDLAMVVRVPEQPEQPQVEGWPPLYWRALTYDVYTGHGWQASGNTLDEYAAHEPALSGRLEHQMRISQTVTIHQEQVGLVYVAGELLTVDRRFEVVWRGDGDIFGATSPARSYTAESYIPVVGAETLRDSNPDYPAWVRRRYMWLPIDVPDRVRELAVSLTAAEPTPYDRAKAIESYLRSFPYTLDVHPPPDGEDVAEYFLFDLQRGYCDYYATSMVVMARAAGIPARLAVGYIGGDYDPDRKEYVVTQADAHSWPELYFPQAGWVTFEPTAGRPALDRPDVDPPVLEEEPGLFDSLFIGDGIGGGWNGWFLLPVIPLLIIVSAAGFLLFEAVRMRRLEGDQAIELAYSQLRWLARKLGLDVPPGLTPSEFDDLVEARLSELWKDSPFESWTEPTQRRIVEFIDLFVLSQYSSERLIQEQNSRALELWGRLRWAMLAGWIWSWVGARDRRSKAEFRERAMHPLSDS